MKVSSFTGNHIYTVQKGDAQHFYHDLYYNKDNSNKIIEKLKDERIMVLDGKDAEDFKNAASDIRLRYDFSYKKDNLIKAYEENAINIDLTA